MCQFISIILIIQACLPAVAFYEQGNIWESFFKDPVEKVVFIFEFGNYCTVTTYHENGIFVECTALAETLRLSGFDLKNCIFIIHNHLTPNRASPGDISCWLIYRERGFKGKFGIYYPYNQKLLCLKEN